MVDAFERKIQFEASDVMAMMLPPLEVRRQQGLAAYPSPAKLENNSNRGRTRAIRRQHISYMVEKAGRYKFPAQDFSGGTPVTAH